MVDKILLMIRLSHNCDLIVGLVFIWKRLIKQNIIFQVHQPLVINLVKTKMEPRIKERFDTDILHAIAARYSTNKDSLCTLPGFMNLIYQCQIGNTQYILRISHSSRRNVNLIQAECNWITYLHENGLSVAYPVLSENNQFVETFIDNNGEYFLATLFIKALGNHPAKPDLNTLFFKNYGRTIGKMHSLSKKYAPVNEVVRRPTWDDQIMLDVARNISKSDEKILEKFNQLYKHLKTLPEDKNSFGLIHQDPHTGNLFVDNKGQITLFDFDDCTYSWFINDIALVLFYVSMSSDKPESFIPEFFRHFYDGYLQENELSSDWFSEIHYFLKLRELDIYSLIYNNYDGQIASSQWAAHFMNNRKFRIEQDIPYIDFDFKKIV